MSADVTSSGLAILGWWRENLHPDTQSGPVRGLRARLRRAERALDALAEPRVTALHEALGDHAPADPAGSGGAGAGSRHGGGRRAAPRRAGVRGRSRAGALQSALSAVDPRRGPPGTGLGLAPRPCR